jgi:hypothetical protein
MPTVMLMAKVVHMIVISLMPEVELLFKRAIARLNVVLVLLFEGTLGEFQSLLWDSGS